jgi:hypothetical protein
LTLCCVALAASSCADADSNRTWVFLRFEFSGRAARIKLLNIGEALCVVLNLGIQSGDSRCRPFVVRFQDIGLLLCCGERRLQLRDLVLEGRGIDLKSTSPVFKGTLALTGIAIT